MRPFKITIILLVILMTTSVFMNMLHIRFYIHHFITLLIYGGLMVLFTLMAFAWISGSNK